MPLHAGRSRALARPQPVREHAKRIGLAEQRLSRSQGITVPLDDLLSVVPTTLPSSFSARWADPTTWLCKGPDEAARLKMPPVRCCLASPVPFFPRAVLGASKHR